MRRLQSILKTTNRTLKIWESSEKLRGELYDENNKRMYFADFYAKDGDMDEFRVREYFGFDNNFYRVPFERKNGKIILYPINKQKRIIWSNDDYDEWAKFMEEEITDEEITPEYYHYCRSYELDDERANLNVEVDGYIVAFADLGLWDGRHNGSKVIGTNVKDILSTKDDYATWYCDVHNVKCDTVHHDGRNHILYRVAKNKEQADSLAYRIAYEDMTEEEFRRATKSLRPYVAKVYGW